MFQKINKKLKSNAAFTLAESGQKPHLNPGTKENTKNSVTLNLFQGLANGKISRKIQKDKLLLRRWQDFTHGQMLKRVQHDKFSHVIACNEKHDMSLRSASELRLEELSLEAATPLKRKSGMPLHASEQDRQAISPLRRRAVAFTLAETLIALAVIGIVAALTIPGIVKNYNELAWSTAQDVFARKLDVALKEMNTEGTLTGYRTTEEFVNELKKNIKITKICTGSQITNCFADKVVWNADEDPIEITTSSVKFAESKENAFDWAEPVGIQFVNGINAIIGYNKNCYSDPYNNQYSPSSTCIGIMYDVSGFKKPNSNGKDIASNGNVALSGCAFKFSYDGQSVCFTKIYAPGEYEPLSYSECEKQKTTLGLDYCDDGHFGGDGDYFAGAAAVCGGKTKMASFDQLTLLAKYLYNTDRLSTKQGLLKMQEDRLGPFSAYYTTHTGSYSSSYDYENVFIVWAGAEYDSFGSPYAYIRTFYSSYTNGGKGYLRNDTARFAVCVK